MVQDKNDKNVSADYLLQFAESMTRIKQILNSPRVRPIEIPRLILFFRIFLPSSFLIIFDEDIAVHVCFETEFDILIILRVYILAGKFVSIF